MANLIGLVNRVLFTNQLDKFYIFQFEIYTTKSDFDDAPNGAIQSQNKKTCCVASGNFPFGIIDGQRMKLTGTWKSRIKNGQTQWSLNTTEYEIVREGDIQSTFSYLTTLHGVGPKIAKEIISKFGDNTNQALLHPENLVEIRGISKERAERISELHKNSARLIRISKGLSRLGINDFKLTLKADALYGEDVENIIKNHPYQMYLDGLCSFKVADVIAMAREQKFDPNDQSRIWAAFVFALRDVSQNGDCCIETKPLMEHMEKLLISSKHSACREPLNLGLVVETIGTMLTNGAINREKIGDKVFCFQPYIYRAEKDSAIMLRGLASPTDDAIENEEQFISKLEGEFGLHYDDRQKDAIKSLGKASLVVVTGGPGTGKTTVTRGLIRYRQEQKPDCKILCLAPTGRAAQRMTEATGLPASTIHRGLEVDGGTNGLMNFRRNEDNPLDCDTVFIDEFSMVDILLLAALLKAIKPGTKVVLIGDKDQLPSVGPGCVLKDLIECGKIPVVTLALVFRQGKNSLIAQNAYAIKNGDLTSIQYDNAEFVFVKREGAEETAKACVELFRRGMEKYKDANSVQILTPIRACNEKKPNDTCCALLNPILRDVANPASSSKNEKIIGKSVFRVGDKVMQFTNNYDKNIMNGDSGYIVEIDNDYGIFAVQFGDRRIEYEQDELNQLDLSYATTIHKSQGSEYPMVIMPLCESQGLQMLTRNLVYTGVTRAKVIIFIVGEERAFNFAIKNTNIEKRITTLKYRI